MSKVKSVTFGGDKDATVLLMPERKKKKWVLKFYSIKNKGIPRGYSMISAKVDKGDLLFKLKFKNLRGVQSMLSILNVIRDRSLYDKGWSDANRKSELQGILKDLSIEDFTKLVKAVTVETDRRFNPEGEKKEEKQPEAVV